MTTLITRNKTYNCRRAKYFKLVLKLPSNCVINITTNQMKDVTKSVTTNYTTHYDNQVLTFFAQPRNLLLLSTDSKATNFSQGDWYSHLAG